MGERQIFSLPASAIPVDQDNFLRVVSMNRSDATQANLMVRFLRPDGQVKLMQFVVDLTTDGTVQTGTFRLTSGWILSIGIALADGSAVRGECFVQVKLQHGALYSGQPYQTLISDYLYKSFDLSYPQSSLRSSLDGGGLYHYFSPGSGSPGADVTWTVPDDIRVRIIGFTLRLVTSGTAANRLCHVIAKRGAATLFRVTPSSTQPASTTIDYNFNVGSGEQNTISTFANVPFPPDLVLLAGDVLQSSVDNIQATDNLTVQQLYCEQWLED